MHKDEDGGSESGHDIRSHGLVVPNVLKPRKALEDGFQDAIAIFEEPNPFTKAMYRKNEVRKYVTLFNCTVFSSFVALSSLIFWRYLFQVYAGGKELQLEELHALDYFRKRAEKEKKMREVALHHHQVEQNDPFQRKMMPVNNSYIPSRSTIMQDSQHIQRQMQEHYGKSLLFAHL